MAFEMFSDTQSDKITQSISYGQEAVLRLAESDPNYPTLNWLFDNFYDDPIIYPNIAKSLADELAILSESFIKNNRKNHAKNLANLFDFFNSAFQTNQVITTISD